jgi:hypothetical protein
MELGDNIFEGNRSVPNRRKGEHNFPGPVDIEIFSAPVPDAVQINRFFEDVTDRGDRRRKGRAGICLMFPLLRVKGQDLDIMQILQILCAILYCCHGNMLPVFIVANSPYLSAPACLPSPFHWSCLSRTAIDCVEGDAEKENKKVHGKDGTVFSSRLSGDHRYWQLLPRV